MPPTRENIDEEQGQNDGLVRRYFRSEARAKKEEDGRMVIGGYGAVFNQYTNIGWYAEVVMPGFFDGIKDDRCACLLNHEYSQVLGRKANNTLQLRVDKSGLDYTAVLPSSRADVYELISEGYIYESSFAFTVAKSTWAELDRSELVGLLSEQDLDELTYGGKISVRYLEKGRELFDVSPVTFAAYEGTSTDTREARRSFETWKETLKREKNTAPVRDYEKIKRLLAAKQRSLIAH